MPESEIAPLPRHLEGGNWHGVDADRRRLDQLRQARADGRSERLALEAHHKEALKGLLRTITEALRASETTNELFDQIKDSLHSALAPIGLDVEDADLLKAPEVKQAIKATLERYDKQPWTHPDYIPHPPPRPVSIHDIHNPPDPMWGSTIQKPENPKI